MKIGAIGIRTKIIVGDAATWYLMKKYIDGKIIDLATDYETLNNKPKINDVELSGNKTSEDLGLVSAVEGKSLVDDLEIEKLAGIEENANNYEHPEKHPSSILDVVDVVNGAANKFLNERGEMVDAVNAGLMPKLTGLDVLGYKNQRVTLIHHKIKELRWWANKGIWVGRRVDVYGTNIFFYDNNLTQIGQMNIMGGYQQQSYFCLGDYVYFIHWYSSSFPFKIIAMGLNYGLTDITATLPTVDTTKRFGFAVIDNVPLFIANDSVNVLNFTTPLVPTITSTISIPNMKDYLIGATQESVIINTDTRVLVIDKTLTELMTANYPAGQTARRLTISPEKIPYFIIATSNFIYTRASATFNAFTISMTGDDNPVFISTRDRYYQGYDIMIWYNTMIRKHNIATGKNYVTFSELYNELTNNPNNFILGGTIYSILENRVYLIYSDFSDSAIIINLKV